MREKVGFKEVEEGSSGLLSQEDGKGVKTIRNGEERKGSREERRKRIEDRGADKRQRRHKMEI